jgi:hypothetical protein
MQPLHQATLTQPLQCDLQRLSFAKHNRTTRNGVANCSFKTGSRRQSRKKTILKHFLKWFLEGKLLAPKLRKSADKSLSQPGCSLQYDLRDPAAKDNSITYVDKTGSNLDAATTMRSAKTILQLQSRMEFHR